MRQTRDTLRAGFYHGADLAARLVPTGSRSGRSAATPSRRGAG
jgi:hypothetical protein